MKRVCYSISDLLDLFDEIANSEEKAPNYDKYKSFSSNYNYDKYKAFSDDQIKPKSNAIYMPKKKTTAVDLLRDKQIERVIFNAPAVIVFWSDGTKTVVKCQKGDTWDPEKGLAMAIVKKVTGNKSNFNTIFTKWLSEGEFV